MNIHSNDSNYKNNSIDDRVNNYKFKESLFNKKELKKELISYIIMSKKTNYLDFIGKYNLKNKLK